MKDDTAQTPTTPDWRNDPLESTPIVRGYKPKPSDILAAMTPKERANFFTMTEEAEAACAVCGWAVLCGGCPSEHPDCPGFSDHKAKVRKSQTPTTTWTAREAFACAYCWSEFSQPETLGDTPESYWLGTSERARNECRAIANNLMLLSVARGQGVVLPQPGHVPACEFAMVRDDLGLKREARVREILTAVYRAFRRA